SGRTMMSGFHGLFSVGGIAGAGGVSALLWLGLSPLTAIIATVILMVILLLTTNKNLLHDSGEPHDGPQFILPRGWVMFVGFLCFVMFLAEGSVLDWSAVFLTTLPGMNPSQAGMGYALFAIAMTLGRLNGDRIVNSLGRYKVLLIGSLCAAIGIILVISVANSITALIGFMLVGLGASNVVPILFTAAGNQTVMPANLAVASITTIGYIGILAGPAAIGFIAQLSNLSVAFGCVALLLLTVTASARTVTR
ncbi:MAG: hypothetical protein RLY17_1412, partial [Pseudomonadota bacterium]